MADDDMHLAADPAPLPRHERTWRHPSEIGQHRRATSRRAAPPLSPLVASLCGALGLALVIALVALVLPPSAKREIVSQVRNAVAAPRPASDARPLPGFMTVDGRRFVLRIGESPTGRPLFATTGNPSKVVVDDMGRRVSLTVVRHEAGMTLLSSDVTPRATPPFETTAKLRPATGSKVVVRGRGVVSALIGISVNTDRRNFVPLAGDIHEADVAESSVVEDGSAHVLGLYTERDGARGYVPISVIEEVLLRP